MDQLLCQSAQAEHHVASHVRFKTGFIHQVCNTEDAVVRSSDIDACILEWQSRLLTLNYLSILPTILCALLLLSFLVLPSIKLREHYLSIGLLIPVLLISLSFANPVSTTLDYCYDSITPADVSGSISCAWTGSLATLGGLGCVTWVFLRSL